MRVMMLVGSLARGGAETTAFEFARGLAESGVDMHVVALRNGGEMTEDYARAGLPLTSGLLRFKFDIFAAFRLKKILCEVRPDAVIMVDALKNLMFLGGWAIRNAGFDLPTILWSNSVPTGQMGDFGPRLSSAVSRGWVRRVVCTSQVQADMFTDRGVQKDAIRIIYNGIDIERFAGAAAAVDKPDCWTWVQVANVMPDKDFDTLISAAEILKKRGQKFAVQLVGRDTDGGEIRAKIRIASVGDCVLPLGARSDVPELLKAADGFVLSSKSEVFNVASLEALAAGKVLVVSDLPAFREMLTDEVDALKPAAGDAKALADAMQRVMTDAELADKLRQSGQATVQKYSRQNMCSQFRELIDELVGR